MRRRRVAFALVSGVSVLVIAGVFVAAALKSGNDEPAPSALSPIRPGDLLAISLDPRRPTSVGRVVVVPGATTGDRRRTTALRCKRVAYAGGSGICVAERRTFPTRAYTARFFDADQRVRGSVNVNGFPSRTRVSPGGSYAASTTFVSGDSYETAGQFSTRTVIFDARRAKALLNLEELAVTRNGKPIRAVDFNYWGVTFEGDDGDFYATLATGDHHYLVKGDVTTRRAAVLRDGVECPSLSPDGTHIAFKARVGDPFVWRLRILDLRSGAETDVPTPEAFDDQAEWLDNEHLAYDRNQAVMRVNAGGRGKPVVLLPAAESSAAVR